MQNRLYTGKAKEVWSTSDPEIVKIVYLDQVTALNGKQKTEMKNKGKINNEISTLIFEFLNAHNIPTHYLKTLSPTEELVKKVEIIPLEMITRNYSAGHFTSKFNIAEGIKLTPAVEEMCYKNDQLDDPAINESQAVALNIVTHEELQKMWRLSRKVNELLTKLFDQANFQLVDFKLEFGRTSNDKIILADEFSPDNCRLWDKTTQQRFDKDVYRKNTGDLVSMYQNVLTRLKNVLGE